MPNKFPKSGMVIFFIAFAIIVTIFIVNIGNKNEVVETVDDGSMTAVSLETEDSLIPTSTNVPASPTPEPPIPTSTSEATAIPTQAENVDAHENAGVVFFVQNEDTLASVEINGEGDVVVLSKISGESDFLPYSISSSGDMIVLSREQDGNQDIIVVNPKGEDIINLTEDDLQHYSPRFSPDDTKIAFSSLLDQTYTISVTDLKGTVLNSFDINACRPELAWLDNENLLFVSCENGYDISILNIDSGEISALTAQDGEELAPAVSKNGKQVAFKCRKSTNDDFEICVMELSSQEILQLTENNGDVRSVSWSADGNLIVYTSKDGVHAMDAQGNENGDLSFLTIEGSNLIYWNQPQGQSNVSAFGSDFSEMVNHDCLECHSTVPQTHMERTVIVSQYDCHDCHVNLEEIHTGD